MRDGTFFFFFYKASSFVSSLRLMKSAFQSTPGPDTQTPKALSRPIHKVSQRIAVVFDAPSKPPPPSTVSLKTSMHTCDDTRSEMQTCSNAHSWITGFTFVINSQSGLMLQHIHYRSCRPVYFYCLKTASIHYPKIFFVSPFLVVLFFPTCLEVTH